MQSLTSVYEAGRNLDSFQVLVVVLGLAVGCQDLSLQKQLCREIASLVLCSKGPLDSRNSPYPILHFNNTLKNTSRTVKNTKALHQSMESFRDIKTDRQPYSRIS